MKDKIAALAIALLAIASAVSNTSAQAEVCQLAWQSTVATGHKLPSPPELAAALAVEQFIWGSEVRSESRTQSGNSSAEGDAKSTQ